MKSNAILAKLRGGDRRSVGKVEGVIEAVHKKPELFNDLVSTLFDEQAAVRMRAADALEKISLKNPELLQPFKATLIDLAQKTRQQELRWHIAQMIPRLKLTPEEKTKMTEIFFGYLQDNSRIVVTFAMQALAELAPKQGRVISAIENLTRCGSPAIKSRGNKLLRQLAKKKSK